MSDITRFIEAHNNNYKFALAEIKRGRKESHWMWYIFPQMKGLGRSHIANYYAIKDLEEAKAYMEDILLKSHMFEICTALLNLECDNVRYIFGFPDDMKLHSSMTLF